MDFKTSSDAEAIIRRLQRRRWGEIERETQLKEMEIMASKSLSVAQESYVRIKNEKDFFFLGA